jgi:hypothetical protein
MVDVSLIDFVFALTTLYTARDLFRYIEYTFIFPHYPHPFADPKNVISSLEAENQSLRNIYHEKNEAYICIVQQNRMLESTCERLRNRVDKISEDFENYKLKSIELILKKHQ